MVDLVTCAVVSLLWSLWSFKHNKQFLDQLVCEDGFSHDLGTRSWLLRLVRSLWELAVCVARDNNRKGLDVLQEIRSAVSSQQLRRKCVVSRRGEDGEEPRGLNSIYHTQRTGHFPGISKSEHTGNANLAPGKHLRVS